MKGPHEFELSGTIDAWGNWDQCTGYASLPEDEDVEWFSDLPLPLD